MDDVFADGNFKDFYIEKLGVYINWIYLQNNENIQAIFNISFTQAKQFS